MILFLLEHAGTESLFVMEGSFHKLSNANYVSERINSGNPAGGSSTEIPQEILQNASNKLLDEIKNKFPSHSFQLIFLDYYILHTQFFPSSTLS